MTAVLLDTGPLIAVVDRDDKHHASCVRLLETLDGPLLLPATILIEAGWTINRHMGPSVHAQFLDLVTDEFELVDLVPQDVRRMAELVRGYKDARLDPADVSVVAIAERLSITHIVTIDRRDFSVSFSALKGLSLQLLAVGGFDGLVRVRQRDSLPSPSHRVRRCCGLR